MFRLWGKIWTDNHMMKDTVICNDTDDTRTHKIFQSLEEICYLWDLSKPIWLDNNIMDFKRHDKTRFTSDILIIWKLKSLKSSLYGKQADTACWCLPAL